MAENPPLDSPPSNPQPTLATIVRLVEQSIVEQQETRARLDVQTQITRFRFDGFQKQLDAAEDRGRAEFLTLTNDIADVRKHVGTIEEHVGFLTKKVAEHDKRFDGIDARLDGIDTRLEEHDKRFDAIDTRLDGIDARLEEHDKRFDAIDTRLEGLTLITTQIRDAVLPPSR